MRMCLHEARHFAMLSRGRDTLSITLLIITKRVPRRHSLAARSGRACR